MIRQARTFAALQGDVAAVRPAFEPIHHIGQSRATFREVRRVDLRDVTHTHHFGAGTGAGDECLHLLRRQVLRLVDDEVLIEESATAHEVERLDLDA